MCEKHYPARKGGPLVDIQQIWDGSLRILGYLATLSYEKNRYSIIDGIFHYDISSGFHSERVTLMK